MSQDSINSWESPKPQTLPRDLDKLPSKFKRLVMRPPRRCKIDPEVETNALKELEVLDVIYTELLPSGRIRSYEGRWRKRQIPINRQDGTTFRDVKLPDDVEAFTSTVLAGILSYLVGRHVDILVLDGLLKDVNTGKIRLKDGRTEFPRPYQHSLEPLSDIEQAKTILRDWLRFYKIRYKYTKDIHKFKRTLDVIAQTHKQYMDLHNQLVDIWPSNIPILDDGLNHSRLVEYKEPSYVTEELMTHEESDTSDSSGGKRTK